MYKKVVAQSSSTKLKMLKIPDAADNFLEVIPNLDVLIKAGIIKISPILDILKRGFNGRHSSITTYKNAFKKFGEIAGIQAGGLLYPCGGVNVHSPFMLNKGIRDVFSIGQNNFGSLNSIELYFKYLFTKGKVFHPLNYNGYDKYRVYDAIERRVGGIGSFAIMRINTLLNANIDGVFYFNIDEDGELEFFKENISAAAKENAVILFTDEKGEQKRFWYLKRDLKQLTAGDNRFFTKAAGEFRNFFLKASMGLVFEEDVPLLIELAILNNWRILAEKVGINKHQLKWAKKPQEIHLPKGVLIGYSAKKRVMNFGKGKDLKAVPGK
jgi:hypothetical protein